MKTYEQLLDEVVTDEYYRINPVAVNIHKNVAKRYAKQWVDKLAKAMNKNQGYGSMQPESIVTDIKKEIDNQ